MHPPDFLPVRSHQPLTELGTARHSPEGTHAISVGDVGTQVVLLPGSDPSQPLAALIPLDSDTLGRVEALTRFWRSRHGRKVPADTRMTIQQRRRLRLKLQAADGRMNGASYREIAIAIFGKERLASEPWKTSPLRDTIIGLVEEGFALIDGGYLKLLRHRRRS
ncbi:DUF2285 domain-containing protein [Microvirga vignae]|uniref:DUF2285 domain-containing protein n=1 Tax=Microvirga vignae TaxID=1225564 RepID=UPI000B07086F